jgi:hypothetical protein
MMPTAVALSLSVLFITLPGFSPSALGAQPAPANPRALAMVEFKKRIDAYLELRKAVTHRYPEVKETGDPAKIHDREVNLGQGIARARANAKAGDIFGPVSRQLLETVEADWNSRSAADRRAILAEIPEGLRLNVNQPYPSTIALATVPPKLLAQLPTLPEELEYRLVDRRLLLRDRDANLIVDVLVGAEPSRTE